MRNFTRRDALLLSGGALSAALFSAWGLNTLSASALDSFGKVRFTDVDGTGSVSLTDAQKQRYKALFGDPDKHGYAPYAAQGVTVIGGGRTFWLTKADGVTYDGQIYCTEPATGAPNRGTYDAVKLTKGISIVGHQMVADNYDEIVATLYFGYGGPGFDASMWPLDDASSDSWLSHDNANVKPNARAYWWTHLVLATACWLPFGTAPSHGDRNGRLWINAADAFWDTLNNWLKTHILGSGSNSMRAKIRARMDEVPESFKDSCFVVYDEHSSNAGGGLGQIMVGWLRKLSGSLTVNKVYDALDNVDRSFAFKVTFSGTDAPADVTFNLKNGQSKTIADIPLGVKYAVTETAVKDVTTTWTNRTGTINSKNVDATCTCTNRDDRGTIKIVKQVESGGSTSKQFEFKLVVKRPDGTTFMNKTFNMSADTSPMAIKDIPLNYPYTVTETPVDGWTCTWTHDTGVITKDGSTVTATAKNIQHGYLKLTKDVTD